jgi:transcriptional regulator with XRE-family HTH domain
VSVNINKQTSFMQTLGYKSPMGRKTEKTRPEQGQRLSELRKASGLSQYQLASRIGVTQSSVGYWEMSDKPPRAEILPQLAQALGVTVEDILNSKTKKDSLPALNGKARKMFVEISQMPRSQQDKICSILEPYVSQYRQGEVQAD